MEIIIIQIVNPKFDSCFPFLAILKVSKISYMPRLVLLPLHWTAAKCKYTAQLLTCTTVPTGAPSWCGQRFQASHKIQAFFLLTESWAGGCFCSVSLHRGQGPPGNGWPWAAISLAEGDSEQPTRRKPWASTYSLLWVDLWLLAFLWKAASSWKGCGYLGPNCVKQDLGCHSQGQELMSWMLSSPIAWCLSPSLQLVQNCKN